LYVACSSLCFGKLPQDDALRTIRDLHFVKVDLAIHADGPHLRPADVVADPGKVAQKLKSANVGYAAFHLNLGAVTGEPARTQVRAVCRLARTLAVPIVTVPAAPLGSDFDAEVVRLADWVRIAEAEGVILSVETDSKTLTADPAVAAKLCERVPGLGITLDPSHYHCAPNGAIAYDELFPHVRHVRLRDSGAGGKFQVRVGQGEIEYGRIVAQLDRCRYERALTVDIRDAVEGPFPVEPEVRKLKYLIESLV
jgi:sugar phosphate isomerase/epimerase